MEIQSLKVAVVSPGDVSVERSMLEELVKELNQGVAADRGLRLEVVYWETDAHPRFHPEGPKGLIDSFLGIEDNDILIGIFWKRFGTPIKDAQSGTEHEIRKTYEAWKETHRPQITVYFNQKAYTPKSKMETDQWGQILKFKNEFPKEGLWWDYDGPEMFGNLIRNHLTEYIHQHTLPVQASIKAFNSKKRSPVKTSYDQQLLSTNPYSAGPMVTDNSMFFGRERELGDVHANLLNIGSVSVVGMRRIGKSSLLYHLSHHTADIPATNFLFAYLDLQSAQYHTLRSILNGILQQWYQKLGRPYAEVDDLAQFSRLVRALRSSNWNPIVCLDEFERLVEQPEEFTDDFFEGWRSLSNERQMSFVTASRTPLAELLSLNRLTSSFHNVFVQVNVGLLSEIAAADLLAMPPKKFGINVPAERVTQLMDISGRHPFYLQMAGSIQFNANANSLDDFDEIKEEFEWRATPHFRDLWGYLSVDEQAAVFVTVGRAIPASNIYKYWRDLSRFGVLQKVDENYKPFSRSFSQWVVDEADIAKKVGFPESRDAKLMPVDWSSEQITRTELDSQITPSNHLTIVVSPNLTLLD